MSNLSPAAKKIRDAVINHGEFRYNSLAAAALRALANAIAPEVAPHRRKIRAEIFAIAAELEAAA